jgi:hypothetical protein
MELKLACVCVCVCVRPCVRVRPRLQSSPRTPRDGAHPRRPGPEPRPVPTRWRPAPAAGCGTTRTSERTTRSRPVTAPAPAPAAGCGAAGYAKSPGPIGRSPCVHCRVCWGCFARGPLLARLLCGAVTRTHRARRRWLGWAALSAGTRQSNSEAGRAVDLGIYGPDRTAGLLIHLARAKNSHWMPKRWRPAPAAGCGAAGYAKSPGPIGRGPCVHCRVLRAGAASLVLARQRRCCDSDSQGAASRRWLG